MSAFSLYSDFFRVITRLIIYFFFIYQADNMRQQTLQHMHRILTTRQSARALLAINDYFSRLRALSSLWLARPREWEVDISSVWSYCENWLCRSNFSCVFLEQCYDWCCVECCSSSTSISFQDATVLQIGHFVVSKGFPPEVVASHTLAAKLLYAQYLCCKTVAQ